MYNISYGFVNVPSNSLQVFGKLIFTRYHNGLSAISDLSSFPSILFRHGSCLLSAKEIDSAEIIATSLLHYIRHTSAIQKWIHHLHFSRLVKKNWNGKFGTWLEHICSCWRVTSNLKYTRIHRTTWNWDERFRKLVDGELYGGPVGHTGSRGTGLWCSGIDIPERLLYKLILKQRMWVSLILFLLVRSDSTLFLSSFLI